MTEAQTSTTQQPTRPDVLERILFVLAVAALALAPMQLVLKLKGIPLHPAEPVLMLAALVWAVRWLWARNSGALPPLSHWLLVFATFVSIFAVTSRGQQVDAVKEVAQTVLYLIVACTIFRTVFTSPRRFRTAVIALLATTTLAVALGVAQRVALQTQFQPDPARRVQFSEFTPRAYLSAQLPFHVSSTFGGWSEHGYLPSRAAYAGFLALVLPFALALLVSERKRPGMVIWASVLLLGAAASMLAGYLAPALLAGLLVTGVALGPEVGRRVLIGIVLFLLASAAFTHNRQEVLLAPWQPRITAEDARQRYPDGVRHLKKFWGEQQAALNIVRNAPLLGIGAGGYQRQIGQSYDLLGKIDEQRSEPGAVNGYLVAAAGTGLLGLAALLLLYGGYVGTIRCAALNAPGSPWTAALYGAMVALLLVTLATNPWVRGTSLVIAAWLAAIGNHATLAAGTRIQGVEDDSCERSRHECC